MTKALGYCLLALVLFGGLAGFLARRPLLQALGDWLYFSQAPRSADAIVAVSGEESRRLAAIGLYKQGLAPRLIFNVSDTSYYFGQPIDPVASVLEDAERHGVPRSDLIVNRDVGSTWEDAQATRRTVAELGLRSLIVVSSPFNMRRLAWTYGRVFRGSGIELCYVSVAPTAEKLELGSWWTRERELVLVNNEYLKLIFYYFKYCGTVNVL